MTIQPLIRALGLGWLAPACVASCLSCASPAAPIAEKKATLGGDTVALVGASSAISADLVARVASAQRVDSRIALDRLVDDALAAEGALAAGLDRPSVIAWPLVSTRARIFADHVREDARAAGPPTDAEIAELTALHWKEVAAPEAVRVIHAIVVRKAKPAPGDDERAKAIAADLARAVAPATSDADFDARAKAVPHDGFELKVESLPAFVLDGRVSDVNAGGAMDAVFVKAAFALSAPGTPGATSGVVETEFGWHVIRLLERIPPRQTSLESRRAAFADEVLARRGLDAVQTRLDALRASTKIDVMTDAESLMSVVSSDRARPAPAAPASPIGPP